MKVTHISYADLQGGAALAAYRLHQGLLRAGVDSKMFVEWRESEDQTVVGFRYPTSLAPRLRSYARHRLVRRELLNALRTRQLGASHFSDDRSRHGAQILHQFPPWDILQLHWVSGMLDFREFFKEVPQDRPIVWTLHDMNAFTGGCHFDAGCGRFSETCGCCPQLNSKEPNDFSARSWARKRSAYESLKCGILRLVTPSRWLADQVKRSSLLRDRRVTVIPYGLDTEIFRPRHRNASRDVLGLPPHHNVVLFLADRATETRKGFAPLVEALKDLPNRANLCLLVLGQGQLELPSEFLTRRLDYMRDERILSMIYSAADIFVLPSLQDNLPNTALEAISCGLPVVAFAAGGIPEIIRDGVEGRLVKAGDVQALRSAVLTIFHDEQLRMVMGSNARTRALQEYTLELQAQRYLELYRSLANCAC